MSPKRRRHRTRDTHSVAQHEEEVGLGVGSAAQRYAAYKTEAQAAASLRARWVSTLSFTPDPFQIQALDICMFMHIMRSVSRISQRLD